MSGRKSRRAGARPRSAARAEQRRHKAQPATVERYAAENPRARVDGLGRIAVTATLVTPAVRSADDAARRRRLERAEAAVLRIDAETHLEFGYTPAEAAIELERHRVAAEEGTGTVNPKLARLVKARADAGREHAKAAVAAGRELSIVERPAPQPSPPVERDTPAAELVARARAVTWSSP